MEEEESKAMTQLFKHLKQAIGKAFRARRVRVEPTIISRSEHVMSRQMISENALKVLYRLHNSGFDAYLVGGCVRDLLLGAVPKDFDVVSDAKPKEIKRLFRNCVLLGRRFSLAHIRFHGEIIEVATFRAAVKKHRMKSITG